MKKVNIKDVDATEVEEDTKKFNVKKLILLILIVITTLVGIFFWSTEVRWNAEIEDYHEILYYGQEEIKIDELTGFYGNEVDINIADTEAILMYCSSQYGGTCVTGDFNNTFENLLRDSSLVINIVILIDLILLFILFKDKCFGKIKNYIIFGVVLIYGLINIGFVIYDFANYYSFVNDSKNVVTGYVVRQLITENKNEYYPVVEYVTEQGEFTNYILSSYSGEVSNEHTDKNKITIYYDRVDSSICTIRQDLKKYVLPLIVALGYVILSIIFVIRSNKMIKDMDNTK